MLKLKFLRAAVYRLCLIGCLPLMAAEMASAAQASIERPFADAANHVVTALETAGLIIKERADTDRFAIVYAQGDAQQSVAITLFALPEQTDRITITVNSASPADEYFDHQMLQSIRTALLEP